jgi:hypothetical protein
MKNIQISQKKIYACRLKFYTCENYLYNKGKYKNICKHIPVVESYTIYLKILIQRDWIREKRWKKYYVSMSGSKSLTFYDESLDWFKYYFVFFVI